MNWEYLQRFILSEFEMIRFSISSLNKAMTVTLKKIILCKIIILVLIYYLIDLSLICFCSMTQYSNMSYIDLTNSHKYHRTGCANLQSVCRL